MAALRTPMGESTDWKRSLRGRTFHYSQFSKIPHPESELVTARVLLNDQDPQGAKEGAGGHDASVVPTPQLVQTHRGCDTAMAQDALLPSTGSRRVGGEEGPALVFAVLSCLVPSQSSVPSGPAEAQEDAAQPELQRNRPETDRISCCYDEFVV